MNCRPHSAEAKAKIAAALTGNKNCVGRRWTEQQREKAIATFRTQRSPAWKDGQKWCWRCKRFRIPSQFARATGNADGLLNWCRECNRELTREYGREWRRRDYQKNRSKRIAISSAWNRQHPDSVKARGRVRRARKAGSTEHFTIEQWNELCEQYQNRCLCCGETPPRLEPDHVIPLARGGSDTIDNIQPLCPPCNRKKYVRVIDYRVCGKAA
jgi:5-methylcytosine-specific restriction endonuclease McrA